MHFIVSMFVVVVVVVVVFHSDVTALTFGGAVGVVCRYLRSRELYLRWCELAAFTCMYRSHLGTLPDQNWQFDDDNTTLQQFFKMAVVFKSWDFYRTRLMDEASSLGWPVVQHMMLTFPNNSHVYRDELTQQFMLGTELLVAPVMNPGQDSVKVFLPGGLEWVWLWDSATTFTGWLIMWD